MLDIACGQCAGLRPRVETLWTWTTLGSSRLVRFVFTLVLTSLSALSAIAQDPVPEPRYHPSRVLVRFKSGTPGSAKTAAHMAAQSVRILRQFHVVEGLQSVEVPEGTVAAAVNAYNGNPDVLHAQPVLLVRVSGFPNEVDNEHFQKLWGIHNLGQAVNGDYGVADADIDAPQAWDWWQGCVDPVVCEEMKIAIIDTGVDYKHPDLADNIWFNSVEDLNGNGIVDGEDRCAETPPVPNGDFNCVDDDSNGKVDDIIGYNFLADSDPRYDNHDPMDDRVGDDASHGTHVAGIIAATGDNNGQGVVGVNWRAKIVALKVFPSTGPGAIDDVIAAVEYCKDMGIKISNNSYGWDSRVGNPDCGGFQSDLYDAISDLHATVGHVFVAAAGNYRWPGCGSELDNDVVPYYPGSYDLENIIAVAATNNDDGRWSDANSSSHYGATTVDIGAPGAAIFSTFYDVPTETHTYGFMSGTSMATPFVTGVVALVWSRYPDWTWEEVRDRTLETARPVAALRLDGPTPVATGGVVNAMYALAYDCNDNEIADVCDFDCGVPGGECDVPGCGTSPDCYGNESDCCVEHEGGDCEDPWISQCVRETYDPTCETSWVLPCPEYAKLCGAICAETPDGLLDVCQASPDCNQNDTADADDIAQEPGSDCNGNCIPDECEIDINSTAPGGPYFCDADNLPFGLAACAADCNNNGLPDECDITSGASCDWDEDGIPDECFACCFSLVEEPYFECRNLPPADCVGAGGTPFDSAGLTCHSEFPSSPFECACGPGACCDASTCMSSLTDCECYASGWHFAGGGQDCGSDENCDAWPPQNSSNPCCAGSCCAASGACDDTSGSVRMYEDACDWTYVGGASCNDDPCAEPIPRFPDCNDNGVFDSIETIDCNNNCIPDQCDVPSSANYPEGRCERPDCSSDRNENGVPDECEGSGDWDLDCLLDVDDYMAFNPCYCDPEGEYPEDLGCIYLDMTCDHEVTIEDLALFQIEYNTEPACCREGEDGPCEAVDLTSLAISTNRAIGTTAHVFPNSAWVNETQLMPSETSYYYSTDPDVTLTLLDPVPTSFLYWRIDNGLQPPGQETVSVTVDQARTAQAVFVTFVDANASGDKNGASWNHAHNELHEALAVAVYGSEIWVASADQHAYTPDPTGLADPREATFQLFDGVKIFGGFVGGETSLDERDPGTNVTVLSGDLNGDDTVVCTQDSPDCDSYGEVCVDGVCIKPRNADNSYHVVKADLTDATAVLDGFVITAGNADAIDPGGPNSFGGGIASMSATPTIVGCTFRLNTAFGGGAVFNTGDAGSFINCVFTGNWSTGDGPGAMKNFSTGASPTLTNCTFSANAAPTGTGGAIRNDNASSPTVTNCIFWGNRDSTGIGMSAQITNSAYSFPVVTYTCVQDEEPDENEYPGTGNIDDDPEFIDPNGPDNIPGTDDDDLRLYASSPCIDEGDDSAVTAWTDLLGYLRTYGVSVDMGAYEFQCSPVLKPVLDPRIEPNPPINGTRNRYVSFVPGEETEPKAFRATLVASGDDPDYTCENAPRWWVPEPNEVREASGSNNPIPPPTFWAAQLADDRAGNELNWNGYGVVHTYAAGVIPGSLYHIQAIRDVCNGTDESHFSAPLEIYTSAFGDVVGDCGVYPCTAPNNVVDFRDISAVVDKYMNKPTAPQKARADLGNNDILNPLPDRIVDFVDVSLVDEAFRDQPYPYPVPPCP